MGGNNAQATAQKALFYTKFEGNTAGDERFLEIILGEVVKGLARDTEIYHGNGEDRI